MTSRPLVSVAKKRYASGTWRAATRAAAVVSSRARRRRPVASAEARVWSSRLREPLLAPSKHRPRVLPAGGLERWVSVLDNFRTEVGGEKKWRYEPWFSGALLATPHIFLEGLHF